MAGADREGPDKEKERRYALVAWSIAVEGPFEYWKNFIKIACDFLEEFWA